MFYLWSRNKHVARENLEGHLRIHTRVHESFFTGGVTIVMRVADLTIVSLEAEMPRPINEECKDVLPVLQKVVGMRVGEGLTKRVDGLVGGVDGCPHMANLVLESCHAAATGFRQVRMAEALAAGLSPDDFYRAWIETRPKELRNSCVSFKDESPLIQRISTPAAKKASISIDFGARLSASAVLPTVRFSRNKFVGVGRLDKDTFIARGMLEDNAHSMQVEVEIRRPSFDIVAVRGQMPRTPTDVCTGAIAALQNAVGLGLRPGLTAAVDERVAREGCPHLANLFLETCHGVIQGTLGADIEDWPSVGAPDTWDKVRGQWLESMPMLRNSCLAYRDDSPLLRRLGVSVPGLTRTG